MRQLAQSQPMGSRGAGSGFVVEQDAPWYNPADLQSLVRPKNARDARDARRERIGKVAVNDKADSRGGLKLSTSAKSAAPQEAAEELSQDQKLEQEKFEYNKEKDREKFEYDKEKDRDAAFRQMKLDDLEVHAPRPPWLQLSPLHFPPG